MRPPDSSLGSQEDGRRKDPSSSSGRTQLARLLQMIVAIQTDRFYNARQLAELCEVSRHRSSATWAPSKSREFRSIIAPSDKATSWPRASSSPHLTSKRRKPSPCRCSPGNGWRATGSGSSVMPARGSSSWSRHSQPISGAESNRARNRSTSTPTCLTRPAIANSSITSCSTHSSGGSNSGSGSRTRPTRCRSRLSSAFTASSCAVSGIWWAARHFTGRCRAFRISRILQAQVTECPYTIPPRFRLERVVRKAWAAEPGPIRYEIGLRFSPEAAPEIRATVWHPGQRLVPEADGHIDLHLVIDGLDEILGWILSYGDQVEVIGPEACCERVGAIARRVAQGYGAACRQIS